MRSRPAHLALLVALLALLGVAVTVLGAPPAAAPEDAPLDAFSAGRAMADVRGLTAGDLPHPVGSADHARARTYVEGRLRALGLAPTVQTAHACSRSGGRCAEVENIVARLDGTGSGPALMLVAHYDSVPAGPGAADDGAGVATVLEVVRALQAAGPRTAPVVVLLDDGEELGLLGARAFVAEHPWAREVRVVVNFEARGTGGPATMFETSAASAWVFEAYAAAAQRPLASSLVYTLYKQLPNDTDLTVFKAAGMLGLNFAFADHVADYHTPNDRADRLDPRSLQHLGDQGLASARALVAADLARPADAEAVYFDLFTRWLVHYRTGWVLPLAVAQLVLAAAALAAVRRGRLASAGAVAVGAAIPLAALFGATFASYMAASWINGLARRPHPLWDAPVPAWVALVAAAVAAASGIELGLARLAWLARGTPRPTVGPGGVVALWGGALVGWTALSLVVSAVGPGASYLFTLPAAACALGLLAFARKARPRQAELGAAALAGLLGATGVGALLWFPILRALLIMVGPSVPPTAAVPVALLASLATPLLLAQPGRSRWAVPVAAGAVALVATGWAAFSA